MAEGRGAVLLEEEMSDPGKTVTTDQCGQQPPRVLLGEGDHQQRQHAAAAEEMQAATGAVAVLAQVERIELSKALELPRHGSSSAWITNYSAPADRFSSALARSQ